MAKKKISRKTFNKEMARLQAELCALQDWVVRKRLKVAVVFEGRDAAGKGGVIKRITQRLNPRVARTVALPSSSQLTTSAPVGGGGPKISTRFASGWRLSASSREGSWAWAMVGRATVRRATIGKALIGPRRAAVTQLVEKPRGFTRL